MVLANMIRNNKLTKKRREQLIALTTTGFIALTQSDIACADEAPEVVNGSDQANVQDIMDSIENSSENSTDKSESEFKSSFLEDSTENEFKSSLLEDSKDESTNKSEDKSDSNIEKDNTKDESENGFKSSFLEGSKDESDNDKTDTSKDKSEDKSKEESTNKSESKNKDKSEGESKSDKKDESENGFKSSFLEGSKDESDNDKTDTSKDKSEDKSDAEFKSSFLEDSKEESDGEFKSSFLSKKDDKSNDESSNEFKSSFLEDSKEEPDGEFKSSFLEDSDGESDKSEDKSDNEFKSSFLDNTANESNDDEDQFVSMMNDQGDEDEDEDTKTIVDTMAVVDMGNTLDQAVAKKKGELNIIGNTKQHANASQVKEYLNPETYLNNEKYKFALLDIGQFREFDYKVFDEYLEKIQPNHYGDTVLRGTGKAFVEAARKYNIDPVYLFAHGMVESDHGRAPLCTGAYSVVLNSDGTAKKNGKTCEYVSSSKVKSDSSKYKKVYNFYGIGAYDASATVGGVTMAYNQNWFSVEEAIEGSAKWIAENYIHTTKRAKQNTLYSMRWNFNNPDRQYATDIYWASTISSIMYKFKDGYVNNDFSYIVPEYTGQNLSFGEDKSSDTKEDKKDDTSKDKKDESKNNDTKEESNDESDDVKSDTEQESDESKEVFKTQFDINGDYLDIYRDYTNDKVKKDKITLSGVVKSIVTPIVEVVGNAVGLEVSTGEGVNNDNTTTNVDNSQSEGSEEETVDVKTGIETADSIEEVLIKAGLK